MSLTRFWFEFDPDGYGPPAPVPVPVPVPAPGDTTVDADTDPYQWLSVGAGVTAYGEDDAVGLLRDVVGADLPPRTRTVTGVDADRAALAIPDAAVVGNAAWRGVWFPFG